MAGPSAAGSAAGSSTDVNIWAYAEEGVGGNKVTKGVQSGCHIQIFYTDEATARNEFKKIIKEHGLKMHVDMEEAKKRMQELQREMAVLKGYTSEAEDESEGDIEFQEEPEEEEQDEIDQVVEVGETEEDTESLGKAMQKSKK